MTSITSAFTITINGQPIAPPPPPTFTGNYLHAPLGNGPAAILRVVNDYIESGDWWLTTNPLEPRPTLSQKVYWLRKGIYQLKEAQKARVQQKGDNITVSIAGDPLCLGLTDYSNVYVNHSGVCFSRVRVTQV